MSLSPVACGIYDAHGLSRRQTFGAAHHQPLTGCECCAALHRVLKADARYHVELLHGIGARDTQHIRMILPNHQRVARHCDGGALGDRGQTHFDRSAHERLGIHKRDAHLELARAIIADRNDRSHRPGLLDPVLAHRDCLSGVDIGGQVKRRGRARLGIGSVDEPHRRGTDLHVLASLDEALGHDAGKRRPNHRLTDLVLRLPQLRIRSRDVIGRHVALRARVLELTGAQRLGGRESIEALQLRAGHLMLGTRALDLRVQVLGSQPRNRVIEPGNRISLSHTCTDFGYPHHPTADHARSARVGAAHDGAWYPAADRHGTHADRPDLDHHAFRGSLRGARGLHGRGSGRDGQQRNPWQAACAHGHGSCGARGSRRTHGGTKDAVAGTVAVSARPRARSSRISAGSSTRLNTRLMTTPPMLTAARPRPPPTQHTPPTAIGNAPNAPVSVLARIARRRCCSPTRIPCSSVAPSISMLRTAATSSIAWLMMTPIIITKPIMESRSSAWNFTRSSKRSPTTPPTSASGTVSSTMTLSRTDRNSTVISSNSTMSASANTRLIAASV